MSKIDVEEERNWSSVSGAMMRIQEFSFHLIFMLIKNEETQLEWYRELMQIIKDKYRTEDSKR